MTDDNSNDNVVYLNQRVKFPQIQFLRCVSSQARLTDAIL